MHLYLKVISGFYGSTFKDDEATRAPALTKLKEGLEAFDKFLEKTGSTFICGEQPGFTDYMVWPHLERVGVFSREILSSYPRILTYFNAMGEDVAVKKCRWSDEVHGKFVEGVKTGNVDYDGI